MVSVAGRPQKQRWLTFGDKSATRCPTDGVLTKEERRTIYSEEEGRLCELHPEGVPKDVLREAIRRRMEQELSQG